MSTKTDTTIFTFGPDHRPPTGVEGDQYVIVTAPRGTDARAILMAWIGGNAFSFEYDERDWKARNAERHYPAGATARITVELL